MLTMANFKEVSPRSMINPAFCLPIMAGTLNRVRIQNNTPCFIIRPVTDISTKKTNRAIRRFGGLTLLSVLEAVTGLLVSTFHSLLGRQLGAVDLSRLFLPPFIGYFDKAEAMSFSHSPQIAYNTVKIAKKRGP